MMAEMNPYPERILYLATAVRSVYPENGNSTFEGGGKGLYMPEVNLENTDRSQITEIGHWSAKNGEEVSNNSIESDVTKWNQEFSKLRPPPTAAKKRQSNQRLKYTNKSCDEILEIVGTFRENLESQQESKGTWEVDTVSSEVHQLWSIDDCDEFENLEGEFPEEIGESYETPIPRNLRRF